MSVKEYVTKLKGDKTSNTTLTGNEEKQTELEAWIADHTDSVVDGVIILTENFPDSESEEN